jgi:hypothetical protein
MLFCMNIIDHLYSDLTAHIGGGAALYDHFLAIILKRDLI